MKGISRRVWIKLEDLLQSEKKKDRLIKNEYVIYRSSLSDRAAISYI